MGVVAGLARSLWFVWYCSCQGASRLVGRGTVVSIFPALVLVVGRGLPVISLVPVIVRVYLNVYDGAGRAVAMWVREALFTGLEASV